MLWGSKGGPRPGSLVRLFPPHLTASLYYTPAGDQRVYFTNEENEAWESFMPCPESQHSVN